MKTIFLCPSKSFKEALALISTSKSWSKWQKPVSKSAYDKICSDVREGIMAFGLDEQQALDFITNYIDCYLAHGILDPKCGGNSFFMGLFASLRRQIDAAVQRRFRAMLSASRRLKSDKSTAKVLSPVLESPSSPVHAAPRQSGPRKPVKAAKEPRQKPKPGIERHHKIRGVKIRRVRVSASCSS